MTHAPLTPDRRRELRDHIADAFARYDWNTAPVFRHITPNADHYSLADSVLAVLPTPADRAAVLREAADAAEQTFIHGVTPAASERDEIWDQAVRAVATMLRGLADESSHGRPEVEAAATLSRECTDRAAVIRWCADRVRWVDDSPAVQDAADYLHDLSTRAEVDTTPVTDRAAVIRWCAQQIHSMGGDYNVERAAEYLDDLAVEAQQVESPCPHCQGEGADPEDEGDWIPEAHQHNPYSRGPCPQCNGRGTLNVCTCTAGSPGMYEGPSRDCPVHGKKKA